MLELAFAEGSSQENCWLAKRSWNCKKQASSLCSDINLHSGPDIGPLCRSWEVNIACIWILLENRCHHDTLTQHELWLVLSWCYVFWEMKQQWPCEWGSFFLRFLHQWLLVIREANVDVDELLEKGNVLDTVVDLSLFERNVWWMGTHNYITECAHLNPTEE